jgi:hypothetical protein
MIRSQCIFLLVTILSTNTIAQKVAGIILDAETEVPIQFVNVYFANTTIGTTTDNQGRFVLERFSPGKYDLSASFVGYTPFSRTLEVNNGDVLQVDIALEPEVINLPEIFVKADNSHWESEFSVFQRHFLGTHAAARDNEIQNPKTLVFYYDSPEKTLYAHARNPIVVKNDHLGYLHTFEMKSFTLNMEEGKLIYYGIPRFENLEPDNTREEKKWERNREKAFYGSILHFFRALYDDALGENEFEVQEIISYPNPERLPEDFLKQRISFFREKMKESEASGNRIFSDSLNYYVNEAKRPKYLDRPGRIFASGAELLENNELNFTGKLLVRYLGAKEAYEYPTPYNPNERSYQHSFLQIHEPVRLYSNGYYEPVTSVMVTGYWSWSNTSANTLPLDYSPPPD